MLKWKARPSTPPITACSIVAATACIEKGSIGGMPLLTGSIKIASTRASKMRTVTGVSASPITGPAVSIARIRQNGHHRAVSVGSSWVMTCSMDAPR